MDRALSAVGDLDSMHSEKGVGWLPQGNNLCIYAVVFSSVANTWRERAGVVLEWLWQEGVGKEEL